MTYKETTSGTHWGNDIGAGISGEAALLAWNNYINASKVSLECQLYHNLATQVFYAVKQSHDPLSYKGLALFRQIL